MSLLSIGKIIANTQVEMKKAACKHHEEGKGNMVPTLVRLGKDAHWRKVIIHI